MSVKFLSRRNKWQADLRFANRGRPLFDSRKEALEAKKAAKLKTLGLGDAAEIPRVLIGVGFKEYFDKESVPRKSNSSRANDEWYFNLANHFLTGEGLEYVHEIQLQHLEDLQRWLGPERSLGTETIINEETGEKKERKVKKAVWSASTINRAFHTYDHFFAKMCAWGKLEKNPAQYLKSLPETPVKRVPMTRENYGQLMNDDKAPAWWKDTLEFMYELGARGSSVARLEWPMVNFKERWLEIDTRKGANASPKLIRLPMIDRVFALLVRVRNKWPGATGPVFRYDDGSGPIRADLISKWGTRTLRRAGIEGAELYGSRHGLASDLINAGVPIEVVRQLLGHSSVKTTQIYTKGTNMETLGKALQLVRGDGDQAATNGNNSEMSAPSVTPEETGT